MTETKKRIKIHAIGSLAQRAVLISLCLLVVPLFLHSLFLYRHGYQIKLIDVEEDLLIISHAQKTILEERMQIEWQLLDQLTNDREMMSRFNVQEILLPQGVSEHFAIANTPQDALLVGKQISPTKAIVLATSFDPIFEQLTAFVKTTYPISVSLIDAQGKALAGAKQETSFSVTLPIKGANFLLYLSIPEGAVEELHRSDYLYNFLSLLFFVGVVGGIIAWIAIRRVARPLHQLGKVMERVGEGAVHVRYRIDWMGF